jgi:pyroglutamyl-peptidase
MPLRILVTGFGRYPRVWANPTAMLARALWQEKTKLARLGIELETAVLPVQFARVGAELDRLEKEFKPAAILHFGVSARRRFFSIEMRALNRLCPHSCDASGATAGRHLILPGAPFALPSTFPARQIAAAFRRFGLHARLSINAGSYVCNETLFLSLAGSKAAVIGFIHVPRLRRAGRPKHALAGWRPDRSGLIKAALIAINLSAQKLRHTRLQAPGLSD